MVAANTGEFIDTQQPFRDLVQTLPMRSMHAYSHLEPFPILTILIPLPAPKPKHLDLAKVWIMESYIHLTVNHAHFCMYITDNNSIFMINKII